MGVKNRKRQAKKKTGDKYVVTAVISMKSTKLSRGAANKLKADIKRKSPQARMSISKT